MEEASEAGQAETELIFHQKNIAYSGKDTSREAYLFRPDGHTTYLVLEFSVMIGLALGNINLENKVKESISQNTELVHVVQILIMQMPGTHFLKKAEYR